MKITVFIYDKDNDNFVSRQIYYDMLNDILLDDYQGKNIIHHIVRVDDSKSIEEQYEEFKKKVHRELSGS